MTTDGYFLFPFIRTHRHKPQTDPERRDGGNYRQQTLSPSDWGMMT